MVWWSLSVTQWMSKNMRIFAITIVIMIFTQAAWAGLLPEKYAERALIEGEIINKAFLDEREAFVYSIIWDDGLFFCYHEVNRLTGTAIIDCYTGSNYLPR